MARRAKAGNAGGLKKETVQGLVDRLENCDAQLERMHSAYMNECKGVKADINSIYEEAEASGVPRKALKAVMKARKLETKAEQVREDLDDHDLIDKFDVIRQLLGDLAGTPLGEAAVKSGNVVPLQH